MLSLEGKSKGWREGEVVISSGVSEYAIDMKVGLVADKLVFWTILYMKRVVRVR